MRASTGKIKEALRSKLDAMKENYQKNRETLLAINNNNCKHYHYMISHEQTKESRSESSAESSRTSEGTSVMSSTSSSQKTEEHGKSSSTERQTSQSEQKRYKRARSPSSGTQDKETPKKPKKVSGQQMFGNTTSNPYEALSDINSDTEGEFLHLRKTNKK